MWYSVGPQDEGVRCGNHSMHRRQFSSSHEGPLSPGGTVTGCDVFLWWHGC